jgi:hypothetical protein
MADQRRFPDPARGSAEGCQQDTGSITPPAPRRPPERRYIMRGRRAAEITTILMIGAVLIALIIYFSPRNPFCFGEVS